MAADTEIWVIAATVAPAATATTKVQTAAMAATVVVWTASMLLLWYYSSGGRGHGFCCASGSGGDRCSHRYGSRSYSRYYSSTGCHGIDGPSHYYGIVDQGSGPRQ